MTKTTGVHSVSSRHVANKSSRVVKNRKYKFFYNPMWNKFGDFYGVPGTYYYSKSTSEELFWNIFDQVVIRPDIIENFKMDDLNIISNIKGESLINSNNKIIVSDHLPIEFTVEEE